MYTYVCIYIYIVIHISIYTYIYIYMYIHYNMCIYIYIYIIYCGTAEEAIATASASAFGSKSPKTVCSTTRIDVDICLLTMLSIKDLPVLLVFLFMIGRTLSCLRGGPGEQMLDLRTETGRSLHSMSRRDRRCRRWSRRPRPAQSQPTRSGRAPGVCSALCTRMRIYKRRYNDMIILIMHTCVYVLCVYVCMCMHIYIYIEREREIHIYIYIHIYTHV